MISLKLQIGQVTIQIEKRFRGSPGNLSITASARSHCNVGKSAAGPSSRWPRHQHQSMTSTCASRSIQMQAAEQNGEKDTPCGDNFMTGAKAKCVGKAKVTAANEPGLPLVPCHKLDMTSLLS
ncbi:hypothetical protein E1301_Tti010573 [Triplophysa tibetana]|uniref:Uncharacterized protein n=1 Tax=Triplophysa tibetana TaxID=1572043 RepID=A0A5A9NE70_9TELE|nr:hypothetical protein E1301_Tti010573 [Triplophysa tibetana]